VVEESTLTNAKIAPLLKRFVNVRVWRQSNSNVHKQVPMPPGKVYYPSISVTDHKKSKYGTALGKITPKRLEPMLLNALKKMGPPIPAKKAR